MSAWENVRALLRQVREDARLLVEDAADLGGALTDFGRPAVRRAAHR